LDLHRGRCGVAARRSLPVLFGLFLGIGFAGSPAPGATGAERGPADIVRAGPGQGVRAGEAAAAPVACALGPFRAFFETSGRLRGLAVAPEGTPITSGGPWVQIDGMGELAPGGPGVPAASWPSGCSVLEPVGPLQEGSRGGARAPAMNPDDDGDGAANEDPLDGRDNDGDGRVDEDYAAISDRMFVFGWSCAPEAAGAPGVEAREQVYHWTYPHTQRFLAVEAWFELRGIPDTVEVRSGFDLEPPGGRREESPRAGWSLRSPGGDLLVARTAGGGWAGVLVLEGSAGSGGRIEARILDRTGGSASLRLAFAILHGSDLGSLRETAATARATYLGVEEPESGGRIRWVAPARVARRIEARGRLVPVPDRGEENGRPGERIVLELEMSPDARPGAIRGLSLDGRPCGFRVEPRREAGGRKIRLGLEPDILPYLFERARTGGTLQVHLQTSRDELIECEIQPGDLRALAPQGEGEISPGDLLDNTPNPFRGRTTIRFRVPGEGAGEWEGASGVTVRPGGLERESVTVKIYNVQGRLIRTLLREPREPGLHSVDWDATDEDGNPVASGVYFYQLDVGDRLVTRRMTLLR
jgi:hypothetical protein